AKNRKKKPADQSPQPGGRRRSKRRPRRSSGKSPDGKWTAFVKESNVYVRTANSGKEIRLSEDGSDKNRYEMLSWSSDSRTLVAFRVEPGERRQVHLIQSSPRSGGRAVLKSRPYPLPGDKFTAYELNLFRLNADGIFKQSKPEVGRIDFGRPRLRWDSEGRRFSYEKIDRGHQRFRLIEVDTRTGRTRNIIDEKTETFIWTSHSRRGRLVTYLDRSDEIIYTSERDGWRHLYLIDAKSGKLINRITKGPWIVRGIDKFDEQKRQIWFRGSGRNPGQDPYLLHFYRVNFDGSGLVALTSGNGNHSIQYSPDRRFLIDTYTRVDLPARHELRRVSDGKLVCELERADVSLLKRGGWKPPEVFTAKGRDGKTDIWGIICRPRDFDPRKKYPVVEYIYAGPHNSHVPKSFSARSRFSTLTDLGFIVVQIDGMGTANRSKAFHDVCWHNLKDAGFPDRILWMKAAAKTYPSLDLTRVGIYGTSAGGQNAAGAVLFHPEFYKVAVAACGCHDNRMDKASWNEQWMGYPVGPHYSKCSNIDNAQRLRGRLLLIVGEMDTNVPPESTLRFVDALIKAGKDFDLLVIPGAGHTSGGSYGRRRLQDFFVRNLQGINPPNRNTSQRQKRENVNER
ncbi:MAG: prolyl oligopeptidase family serine peptidase, partial [Planctomycetes bacterium]|nr:prolyl oligopeptidase family serine peptidase [Planctomycetota bacterium]